MANTVEDHKDFSSSDSDDSSDSDLDYAPSSMGAERDLRQASSASRGTVPPAKVTKVTSYNDAGMQGDPAKPEGGIQTPTLAVPSENKTPAPTARALNTAPSSPKITLHILQKMKSLRRTRRKLSNAKATSKKGSPASEAEATAPASKSKSKRQRVLQEILQTEKTFVSSLRAFYKGYVDSISLRDTPLKRELMARGEIALLFSNIEQIITLNTDFLKRLENTMSSWPEESGGDAPHECVGEFFLSVAPLFALYAQYTSNHDLAVDVLKDNYQDRQDYLDLMKVCETEALRVIKETTGVSRPPQLIGFYLIMPVQRVPRYKMLLQELLKRTPEGHRDNESLPAAVEEVDKAAHKINESIRAREQKQQLVALSSRFQGHVNLAGKHFVRSISSNLAPLQPTPII